MNHRSISTSSENLLRWKNARTGPRHPTNRIWILLPLKILVMLLSMLSPLMSTELTIDMSSAIFLRGGFWIAKLKSCSLKLLRFTKFTFPPNRTIAVPSSRFALGKHLMFLKISVPGRLPSSAISARALCCKRIRIDTPKPMRSPNVVPRKMVARNVDSQLRKSDFFWCQRIFSEPSFRISVRNATRITEPRTAFGRSVSSGVSARRQTRRTMHTNALYTCVFPPMFDTTADLESDPHAG
mmetsp:Transcript_28349/g.69034  ORF Transcript_28349/g.69034 Transcript_28349/m.69034 type:complete len:240 (+) Transcript_28349:407-1126(+)